MVEAELLATVAATTGSDLTVTVLATESSEPDSELTFSVDSDGAVDSLAQPRTVAPVTAGIEIRVDGVAVPLGSLLGGWTVTRSLDQQLQTWSFSVVLDTPTGPLGTPWSKSGPPTCLKTIDIDGVLDGYLVPLITGGISDNSTRSADGNGYVESLNGVDRGGRFDRKKITLALPPGHGKYRGEVVRSLATKAGETQTLLAQGRRCYKEIQLRDTEWLGTAGELVDVEGRALLWSRDGYLTSRRVSKPLAEDGAAIWSFDERDIDASGGVSVQHNGDVLTDVTLSGAEQTTRDGCDIKNTTTIITTSAVYTPATPAYHQKTNGTYDANTYDPGSTTDPIVVGKKVIEREERCGALVWERTTEWAWRNPEALRYEWNTGTSSWDPKDCYTDDNTDEATPAYALPAEQFLIVSVIESWYFYNHAGFYGENLGTYGLWFSSTQHVSGVEAREGDYLGSITQTSVPYAPRAAVKDRILASTAWEDEDYANGLDVLGDGQALYTGALSPWSIPGYQPGDVQLFGVQRVYETHRGDPANGFTTEVSKVSEGWLAVPRSGGLYLYGDGMESADSTEIWRYVGRETEVYLPVGDAAHTRILSGYDWRGELVTAEKEEGAQGYGPALPRLNLGESNPDEYADDAEYQAALKNARRGEVVPISAHVTAPDLAVCHPEHKVVSTMPWAETQDELEQIARRMIADSAAATVTVNLVGPNFFISEGDVVHVTVRPIGLDHDLRLVSVSWNSDEFGNVSCSFTGRLYGW